MKEKDFCYWLQGFFEVANPTELNAEQTEMIKRHLDLVFMKSPITHPDLSEPMNDPNFNPWKITPRNPDYDKHSTGTPPHYEPKVIC